MVFLQDGKICDAKGRSCINANGTDTHSCKTSCQGIHADVQSINAEMDETTKEGLSKLDARVKEYKEYKRSYSRSFMFSSEHGKNFGRSIKE